MPQQTARVVYVPDPSDPLKDRKVVVQPGQSVEEAMKAAPPTLGQIIPKPGEAPPGKGSMPLHNPGMSANTAMELGGDVLSLGGGFLPEKLGYAALEPALGKLGANIISRLPRLGSVMSGGAMSGGTGDAVGQVLLQGGMDAISHGLPRALTMLGIATGGGGKVLPGGVKEATDAVMRERNRGGFFDKFKTLLGNNAGTEEMRSKVGSSIGNTEKALDASGTPEISKWDLMNQEDPQLASSPTATKPVQLRTKINKEAGAFNFDQLFGHGGKPEDIAALKDAISTATGMDPNEVIKKVSQSSNMSAQLSQFLQGAGFKPTMGMNEVGDFARNAARLGDNPIQARIHGIPVSQEEDAIGQANAARSARAKELQYKNDPTPRGKGNSLEEQNARYGDIKKIQEVNKTITSANPIRSAATRAGVGYGSGMALATALGVPSTELGSFMATLGLAATPRNMSNAGATGGQVAKSIPTLIRSILLGNDLEKEKK